MTQQRHRCDSIDKVIKNRLVGVLTYEQRNAIFDCSPDCSKSSPPLCIISHFHCCGTKLLNSRELLTLFICSRIYKSFITVSYVLKLMNFTSLPEKWQHTVKGQVTTPRPISHIETSDLFLSSVNIDSKCKISIISDWMWKRLTQDKHNRCSNFNQNFQSIFAL